MPTVLKQRAFFIIMNSAGKKAYRHCNGLPPHLLPVYDRWVPYITQKFASRNIQVDEDVVKETVRLSGGHPQDTMFLCSGVHYSLLETGDNILTRFSFLKICYGHYIRQFSVRQDSQQLVS